MQTYKINTIPYAYINTDKPNLTQQPKSIHI